MSSQDGYLNIVSDLVNFFSIAVLLRRHIGSKKNICYRSYNGMKIYSMVVGMMHFISFHTSKV